MNRLNVVLLVVLALQAVILAVDRFVIAPDHRPRVALSGDVLFPGLVPANVQSIEITHQERTTRLARGADGWVVASEGDAKADQQAVTQLVDRLPELKPGNVISDNPEKHEELQVAGKDAVQLRVTNNAGAVVAEAVFGKATANLSGTYARVPPGADEVMLVRSNVRSLVVRDGNQAGAWRDKTIFAADPKTIRSLEIQGKDEKVVVERKLAGEAASDQDDWMVVQPVGGQMERYGANSMVSYLADLKAEAIASDGKPLAEMGLEPPEWRVTAVREGAEPLVLDIGKEDGFRRYVRIPGQDEVFLVSSYRLANLIRKGADFPEKKPEDAAAPEGETPAAEGEGAAAEEKAGEDESGDGGAGSEEPKNEGGGGGS